MFANSKVKKTIKAFSIILIISLLMVIFCSSVVSAATSAPSGTIDPSATMDPSSTADAIPVIEPRGCWAWGPGKIFLVSSLITLSLAILISLVQANKKFKD